VHFVGLCYIITSSSAKWTTTNRRHVAKSGGLFWYFVTCQCHHNQNISLQYSNNKISNEKILFIKTHILCDITYYGVWRLCKEGTIRNVHITQYFYYFCKVVASIYSTWIFLHEGTNLKLYFESYCPAWEVSSYEGSSLSISTKVFYFLRNVCKVHTVKPFFSGNFSGLWCMKSLTVTSK
jgi:hypothetical protein